MRQVTKLLLADGNYLIREGIKSLLHPERDILVVGEAVSGKEALATLQKEPVDMVLMDLQLEGMEGLEVVKEITKRFPKVNCLILSNQPSRQLILRVMEAGAKGYLLKDIKNNELITGIRKVREGEPFFSRRVSNILLAKYLKNRQPTASLLGLPGFPCSLTKREKEILKLIVDEFSNKEIAEKLFISERTVDGHRERLREKIGTKKTAGLVKFAIINGIADLLGRGNFQIEGKAVS